MQPTITPVVLTHACAYVYSGMWVAECPREGCGNVEALFDLANPLDPRSPRTVRKQVFLCSYCRCVAEIDWAADEAEIMAVLERRPIPHTRNWYPEGHHLAVRWGIPHGQSVGDLVAESREHGVV